MLAALQRHPLAIAAHFEFSLVLTYACPRRVLEPLLPPGLMLDSHGDNGFVAVAMVQTHELRPAGLPRWLGLSFFLTGYRIFVRFAGRDGRERRGLYILRSDTNRRSMRWLGNAVTHYRYHAAHIDWRREAAGLEITARTTDGVADIRVVAGLEEKSPALPPNSPFASWAEARRFAGPMPFTFDYEAKTRAMVVVEGVRENWKPRPVALREASVAFLNGAPFAGKARLASAFFIEDIPYRWKRGVREPLAEITAQ